MKKAIIGAGGFGKEMYALLKRSGCKVVMFVEDAYYNEYEKDTQPLSCFNTKEYEVIVAIADSNVRERIVNLLPKDTKYFTYIDPTAQIHGEDVEIGEGSIICAGTIITVNVKIGKHAHLNLQTTIGHDNVIGDLQGWFASLIGKTFDEYMELPPQTTLEIIDCLVDSEETKGFFSHALQLYKKMNLLGNRSSAK
jgi:hypothetical protein